MHGYACKEQEERLGYVPGANALTARADGEISVNLTDEDQGAFIRSVGGRLRALHLAENAGKSDEHVMPFARGGSVPWSEIATALTEVGYDGLYNFEVPGENRCPLEVRRLKLAYMKELGNWIFGGD